MQTLVTSSHLLTRFCAYPITIQVQLRLKSKEVSTLTNDEDPEMARFFCDVADPAVRSAYTCD